MDLKKILIKDLMRKKEKEGIVLKENSHIESLRLQNK